MILATNSETKSFSNKMLDKILLWFKILQQVIKSKFEKEKNRLITLEYCKEEGKFI